MNSCGLRLLKDFTIDVPKPKLLNPPKRLNWPQFVTYTAAATEFFLTNQPVIELAKNDFEFNSEATRFVNSGISYANKMKSLIVNPELAVDYFESTLNSK